MSNALASHSARDSVAQIEASGWLVKVFHSEGHRIHGTTPIRDVPSCELHAMKEGEVPQIARAHAWSRETAEEEAAALLARACAAPGVANG